MDIKDCSSRCTLKLPSSSFLSYLADDAMHRKLVSVLIILPVYSSLYILCIVAKWCKIGLWCVLKLNRMWRSTFQMVQPSIPITHTTPQVRADLGVGGKEYRYWKVVCRLPIGAPFTPLSAMPSCLRSYKCIQAVGESLRWSRCWRWNRGSLH